MTCTKNGAPSSQAASVASRRTGQCLTEGIATERCSHICLPCFFVAECRVEKPLGASIAQQRIVTNRSQHNHLVGIDNRPIHVESPATAHGGDVTQPFAICRVVALYLDIFIGFRQILKPGLPR